MAINPKIKQKAEDIRKKTFGAEVRESLASGLEAMSSDVVENEGRQSVVESRQDSVESQWQSVIDETTNLDVVSAPEIIAARNGKSNLKTRLDDEHAQVTTQLQQTEQELNAQLAETRKYANVKGFGAVGDGVTDDTQSFMDAITYANEKEETVYIPNGVYLITETIDLTNLSFTVNDISPDYSYRLIIEGENIGKTVILCEVGIKKLFSYNPNNKQNRRSFTFENLRIRSKEPYDQLKERADLIAFELLACPFTYFKNIDFLGIDEGIRMQHCWFSKFENIVGSRINKGILIDGTSTDGTNHGNADFCYFNDIRMGGVVNEWGLKLVGSKSSNINMFNSEAGYTGHALIIQGCNNIEVDGFYIENYINAQPFRVEGQPALNSVNDFSTDITFKNGHVLGLTTSLIRFDKGVIRFELKNTRFVFNYTSDNPINTQITSMFSFIGSDRERAKYYRDISVLNNTYYADGNFSLVFLENLSLLFKNNGVTYTAGTNLAYYQPTLTVGTVLKPINDTLNYIEGIVQNSGSYGTLNNVTGSISSGSNVATFNDVAGIVPGTYLSIGGFERAMVLSKNPTTNRVVFGKNATTTVTDGAVSYCEPEISFRGGV